MIEDQLERLISAMGRLTAALESSGAKPTAAPAQSTVAKSATVEPKPAPAVAPSVMDESSAPAVAPTAPTVAVLCTCGSRNVQGSSWYLRRTGRRSCRSGSRNSYP